MTGTMACEFVAFADTEVRAQVQVRDEIKQPMGLVHGGLYASLAESMSSLATAAAVMTEGKTALGMSNSTSFLRPITEGTVHAHAVRLHGGRTTWIWDVTFSDDAGRTCAVTRMTIAVRPFRRADDPGIVSPGHPDTPVRDARSQPTRDFSGLGTWEGSGRSPKPVFGSGEASLRRAHRDS